MNAIPSVAVFIHAHDVSGTDAAECIGISTWSDVHGLWSHDDTEASWI